MEESEEKFHEKIEGDKNKGKWREKKQERRALILMS